MSKIKAVNTTVELHGRRGNRDLFTKSGNFIRGQKLTHYPFLVFVVDNEGRRVDVRIVDNVDELLQYPDHFKVMSQWEGKWRSDFFYYLVGDVRKYMEKAKGVALKG